MSKDTDISARRRDSRSSQSPQAKRGSAQDFETFGERKVRTTAHDLPKEEPGKSFGGSLNGRDESGWPEGV